MAHHLDTRRTSANRCATGALVFLICAGCARPAGGSIASANPARDLANSPVSPLRGGLVAAREAFGPFVVVVERDTARFKGAHVPAGWTKIHLLFATPDERVSVALTDNGLALTVDARTSTQCYVGSRFYQYDKSADGSHLYASLEDIFNDILHACPRGMEAAPAYQRLFEQAEPHFLAAIQAMMGRATDVYGGRVPRCEIPSDPEVWRQVVRRCLPY